jgi:hypothetical protein
MPKNAQVSEAAFLAEQARAARAAMGRSACDLTHNLRIGLSPRRWAKEHPWKAMAIPVMPLLSGAGLLSALFLMGRKRQKKAGWFSRLMGRGEEEPQTPRRKKAWWWFLLEQAFSMAQPALLSIAASALGSRFARHNGHCADEDQVR